jgi:hypothetical protein
MRYHKASWLDVVSSVETPSLEEVLEVPPPGGGGGGGKEPARLRLANLVVRFDKIRTLRTERRE